MTSTTKGYVVFIAAVGMMLTLMSSDISEIKTWAEVRQPAFIAQSLAHLGAVITAFIGGRLIPTQGGN